MSNAGFSYTDDVREYMFSPAGEDVILDTIELRNPAFLLDGNLIALRFVNAQYDIMATIEPDAPMDGGQTVDFTATRFELVPPDQPATGLPQVTLAVSNVMAELSPWLALAVTSGTPVELSLRQFLADDLSEPCFVMHGLTFKTATASMKRVVGTATVVDLLNFNNPRLCYTILNSPGLNR